ncbi:hypothetical protein [Dongia sp.]|uniref:hypothetical protein n=1 Tax=Dongia sp. TaxID=1977262 RepID=UPI0035B485FE
MSFRATDFAVLAYANGFTHWHYRTNDRLAEILGQPGYFSAAADMLRAGDQITANLGAPAGTGLAQFVVRRIDAPGQITLDLVAASEPATLSRAA